MSALALSPSLGRSPRSGGLGHSGSFGRSATALNFGVEVQRLGDKARRAAAEARETKVLLQTSGPDTAFVEVLRENKAVVLLNWIQAVQGTIHGPTVFGPEPNTSAQRFADLYDALLCALESKADPPNDAALIAFFAGCLDGGAAHSDEEKLNTQSALWLFEETAVNMLQDHDVLEDAGSPGAAERHLSMRALSRTPPRRLSFDHSPAAPPVPSPRISLPAFLSDAPDEAARPRSDSLVAEGDEPPPSSRRRERRLSTQTIVRTNTAASFARATSARRLGSGDAAVKAITRALVLAEDALQKAWAQGLVDEATTYRDLADAVLAFTEARDTLLDTLGYLGNQLPKASRFPHGDVEAVQKLATGAEEMQRLAQQLRHVAESSSTPKTDFEAQEAKKQDTRQALYHLLTEHMEALGDEWMAQIRRRLDQYKTGTVVVSKDINRRLLRAMIQKIANPDGTDLVYAAQYLVEKRFETLKIESAQATTKLFTDVCMKCYLSFTTEQQTYNKDLLPLLFADQKDVYEILLGVSALAKKLIVKEYAIRVARNHDPRMDSALLARPSSDLSGPVAVKNHLEELMIGAVIAGQYRLDAYIMAGSFGHGWRAVDLQTGLEVFVKTFKSKECFSKHSNVMAGMVEELETAERISKVNHLMNHNNIVAVLKVLRIARIEVPMCGTSGSDCHGIVTEYADGGELCCYLESKHERTGRVQYRSFSEPQARFLFQQIVELLLLLHHPPEPEPAYYHGDLKDGNLVLAGTTVKLIDYGSLSKVEYNTGGARHMTPAYQQPFHDTCEAVDLWAAGIILFDMLAVGEVGRVFTQGGTHELLEDGEFWGDVTGRLRGADPGHCLLDAGPGGAQDLLRRILTTAPRNALSVREIAGHPWLWGPVPTEADMATELTARYRGILDGAPHGTFFVRLHDMPCQQGLSLMQGAVATICRESDGRYAETQRVYEGDEEFPRAIHLRERAPPGGAAPTFVCGLEALPKDAGRFRIRLRWQDGTDWDGFTALSSLLLDEVLPVLVMRMQDSDDDSDYDSD